MNMSSYMYFYRYVNVLVHIHVYEYVSRCTVYSRCRCACYVNVYVHVYAHAHVHSHGPYSCPCPYPSPVHCSTGTGISSRIPCYIMLDIPQNFALGISWIQNISTLPASVKLPLIFSGVCIFEKPPPSSLQGDLGQFWGNMSKRKRIRRTRERKEMTRKERRTRK